MKIGPVDGNHRTDDLPSLPGGVPAEACSIEAEPPLQGRASEVLDTIARNHGATLTLDEVLRRLGDRSFGILLLLLALINCMPMPPLGTTLFGAVLTLVAAQLAVGRNQPWIPRPIRQRSVPRIAFRHAADRVTPVLRKVESLCRPRHSWITAGPFERLIGALIVVLGFVIALPIPIIGNVPPAIAVVILSISLIERDGLAALAGVTVGTLAFLLNVGVVGGMLIGVAHAASGMLGRSWTAILQ